MKEIFISYSTIDSAQAETVRNILEKNGISCWMAPACIPGGSSYAVEIPQAIRQAKVFVLILSSRAQSSRWVSREVDLAINEGKIVLPFMLENCALKDDFNFYLTNVQRYAAYENKVAAIEKMLSEIKAVIGSSAPANNDSELVNARVPVKDEFVNVAPVTPAPEANPVPERRRDAKSVLSLVFGIIGTVFFGMLFVPNFIAILMSVLSLGTMKKKNRRGKGAAIAGLILGVLSTFIGVMIWSSIAGL